MRTHNRSNTLLVELMIVFMFFMLSMTVLVRVFAASRIESEKAGLSDAALAFTQNVAERLYASDDIEKELRGMDFIPDGDVWMLDTGRFTVKVVSSAEETTAGRLLNQTVQAYSGDELLFALPVSRYVEELP